MDAETWRNAALVLVFVLVGGVFAGTELALVSLREGQIAELDKRGGRGRRVASVARDPNRFLAAVQIGVTVAGFFSAAYGASTLAPDFAPLLEGIGLPAGLASTLSLVVLTLVIAYLSLVLGELVPKRIALQRAAQVALVVGPPLDRFAAIMRPVVWLLSRSTDAVVRLLGGDPSARSEEMSEEELRGIVQAHQGLDDDEREILDGVFAASDRTLGEVMRPRGEVVFLEASLTLAEAAERSRDLPYSRYPVTGADFDDVLGFVHVRDLFAPPRRAGGRGGRDGADGAPTTLLDVARPLLELPTTNRLLPTMSAMRRSGTHMALVVDEYGGTDGIVTLEDLVEELVGDIRDEYDPRVPTHADGTYDAGLTIEEFAHATGVELEDGPYETVAGYLITRLGRLAEPGDVVALDDGRELRVTRVEDRRVRAVALVDAAADGDAGGSAALADPRAPAALADSRDPATVDAADREARA
ncbi:hemolysin family protein [Puerhibacterium puerhi]|uniref:hemolysin family protein n=1 Tax=Puerhibacterium puerhi TaxID=2692623 RepID=UPI001356C579|nr:hemolysin family protein [Puerhibacterium puerhi]